MSASPSNQDVQPSNTPFIPELQNQAVLSGSSAAEDSKVSAAQPDQMRRAPKNSDFFQSQTIDGRYKEWVGAGQYAGIKSPLVMNINKLGLPRTKGIRHAKSAEDNLRKKRCLPEAIEQLVVQGLTSDTAVALVTHVVADFGLKNVLVCCCLLLLLLLLLLPAFCCCCCCYSYCCCLLGCLHAVAGMHDAQQHCM